MSKEQQDSEHKTEQELDDQAVETSSDSVEETDSGADTAADEAAVAEDLSSAESEDSIEDQLQASQAQLNKLQDQILRDQAETQNIRKRVQRDVENARKFALEKFAADLLPIMDNLERAMTAAGDHEAVIPVVEGIELTRKTFVETLAKYQIEQIDPHGEPFDPQLHEAMTMVPNPDMEPNSVMDVLEKGYSLNGRLIRAARVVVTK